MGANRNAQKESCVSDWKGFYNSEGGKKRRNVGCFDEDMGPI